MKKLQKHYFVCHWALQWCLFHKKATRWNCSFFCDLGRGFYCCNISSTMKISYFGCGVFSWPTTTSRWVIFHRPQSLTSNHMGGIKSAARGLYFFSSLHLTKESRSTSLSQPVFWNRIRFTSSCLNTEKIKVKILLWQKKKNDKADFNEK